ncbi:MAG: hypothetical protein GXP26_05020 [Planctomycetes bacterium]|nr:hypothetical protein [Planctomycetota bacterium]
MANPLEYRELKAQQRKIRYSEKHGGEFVINTATVEPESPVHRYQGGETTGNDGLIAQIMEAIGMTSEFQFLRKLMAESMPVGLPGGEAGYEDAGNTDAATMLHDKRKNYQRLRRPEVDSMHYQQPRDASDDVQRYEARQQAHAELCGAFEDFNESRKDISDRASQHALRHGCDYVTALAAVGGSIPDVCLPPASAC